MSTNNHDAISASSKNSKLVHKQRGKRRKTKEQRQRAFQRCRIGDLNKLFKKRYGGQFYVFPDDDAGRADLKVLLSHYSYSNPLRVHQICKMRAPWLRGTELDDFMAEAMQ
jgi:hypothetical protein